MGFHTQFGIGDNKEFSVATTGVITVYFKSDLTSLNDDPTNRNYYFNASKIRKRFVLRIDKSVEITQENDVVFTDPITVAIGDGTYLPASGMHKETFEYDVLVSIKINILTAGTNIKLRVL